NYYGFKSLLKNGGWTQRYSCDDETIVFNRIESFTFNGGGFVLEPNQVGVVLNVTNQYFATGPATYYPELIETMDVDGEVIYLMPNATTLGIVITQVMGAVYGGVRKNVVLAIFDLY
ncbi:MAG: hypothetical protein RLZZ577_1205, partial [Bacteroidota bacterium]